MLARRTVVCRTRGKKDETTSDDHATSASAMSNATATSNDTSAASLGGLVGEDAEIMASVLINLQMLGYTLC